jgi:hypothetical protein
VALTGCTHVPSSSPVAEPGTSQVSLTPTRTPTIGEENFRKEWESKYEELNREILAAQSRWNESNIRSYSYVAQKDRAGVSSPWNRSPVLIKVDDGRTISIEVLDKREGSALARSDGFEQIDTFDKLFMYMLSELEKGQLVSGNYDKNLGFPKAVHILQSFEIHGGRSILVSKFSNAQ